MARFINPFTDVGFKRIFGQEINKDLLIDFLNGLLEGEKHIVDIRFLDKEVLPAFAQDRGVIYDVYCTNESGEQFIVEMQNRPQVNFRERALYYLSRAVARQGERGADWQFRLKAVYGVFFMNFCLDSGCVRISSFRTGRRMRRFLTSCASSFWNCPLLPRRSRSVRRILNDGYMC